MNITDFITELYCNIDDVLPPMVPHSQARLSVSELITIGVLHAIKNVKQRPFCHWLKDNYGHLFPKLPERTRLFRRLETQSCWTGYFLASPLSWALPTATELNCAIGCALGVISTRRTGRTSPITAGSLGASSASCSTNWA